MKEVYTIGRDHTCDVVLYDNTNVISRVHAILRVGRNGKYTISDQSMNGTYVNGIRLTPGVEVPVSRTDIISFAHLAELDWAEIPAPRNKTRIAVWTLAVLAVLAAAVIVLNQKYSFIEFGKKAESADVKQPVETKADSLKTETVEQPKTPEAPVKKQETRKPKAKVETPTKTEAKAEAEPAPVETPDTSKDAEKKVINTIY